MRRLLRSHSVRFLLIGTLLFAGKAAIEGKPEAVVLVDRSPVVVTAAHLEGMRRHHIETVGTEPSRSAYDHMIAGFVDDELIYREAVALGMERGDSGTRHRLIEKMEYLDEVREGESEEETVNRAISLGLSQSDPMIRTSLIQKYRMLVRFSGVGRPDERRLRAYYDDHRNRYRRVSRVSLDHVYFGRETRGEEGARMSAESALAKIRDEALRTEDAIALGDVFVGGHTADQRSPRSLAQTFGPAFGEQLEGFVEREWSGPVSSAFGWHVVRVREASPAGYLSFESAYNQVLKAVEDEMRNEQIEEKLAELRSQYEVDVRWQDFGGVGG